MTWKDDIKKDINFSIGQAEDLISRAFNLLKRDLESEDKALREFQGVVAEYLEKYNIYVSYQKGE
jgi:hypothetical protein